MSDLQSLPFIKIVISEWRLFVDRVFSLQSAVELSIVLFVGMVAYFLASRYRPKLLALADQQQNNQALYRLLSVAVVILMPLYWLVMQWGCNWLAQLVGFEPGLMRVTASLLTAWVLIRIVTTFIQSELLGRALALVAWSVAALNIVGWLGQSIELLKYIGTDFGSVRVSLFTVLKGMLALGVLLWVSNVLSTLFENRIKMIPDLTPSVQTLFAKLFKLTVMFIAVVVAISAVGIDMTAFAVIGGAVGVGIGLGCYRRSLPI